MNISGWPVDVAKVAMSFVLYFTLPLKLYPAIEVLEALFIADSAGNAKAAGLSSSSSSALATLFVSDPKQVALRCSFALVPSLIAMVVTNFGFLVEFCGTFCLGIIGFALPPIMYLVLHSGGDSPSGLSLANKAAHIALAAIGVLAMAY